MARPGRRRLARLLLAVGLVLALATGGALWFLNSTIQQIERIEDPFPEQRPEPARGRDGAQPPLNVLLLGSDARGEQGGSLLDGLGNRADAVMVAHVSGDRRSVQIMSVMRDSWVEIPGHGRAKINAALSYGGVPLMVQTVEGLIGQRIDHVAIVDFEGFRGLSETLGGVTVDNETAFSLDGYDFPQGQITLRGEQALVYVRARYPFQDGDYQRVRNQQAFLRGVLRTVLSSGTLGDPAKLTGLLSGMTPHLASDAGLSTQRILELASQLKDVRSEDVAFFTMPTSGTDTIGEESVVLLDPVALEDLRAAFAEDRLAAYAD